MSTANSTRLEARQAGLPTEYDPHEPGRDISRIDLKSYLHRIGYTGSLHPSVETLRGLQRAHLSAIPFENLDLLLGRTIKFGLANIEDKLVWRRRGGYCFEQNLLFAAALERLAFKVTRLSARGPMGSEQQSPVSYSTAHALLKVDVGGASWLADVGLGNLGPLEPVPLSDGVEVQHGGWAYRMDRVSAGDKYSGWMLRHLRSDGWFDVYSFSESAFFQADFEDQNFIASHHPRSPFIDQFVIQQNGELRLSLVGRSLTLQRPNDPPKSRMVRAEELPAILTSTFGLVLEEDEMSRLVAFARSKEALPA